MAFIKNGVNGKNFDEIYYALANKDQYMALADFTDYQRAQREISKAYADRERFVKMSLMNISGAGIFSADRSIMDYASYIWNTKPVQFEKETPKEAKKSAPMSSKKKTTEKKSVEKKTVEKKTEKKAQAKKPAETKAEKKTQAKPTENKSVEKKAEKKPATKKNSSKSKK